MNDSSVQRAEKPSGRGLLCVECEHLNLAGESVCQKCGAELYADCGHCGCRNERVWTRCRSCRRPLQLSWWQRWIRRWMARPHRALIIAAAAVLAANNVNVDLDPSIF